MTLSVTDGNKFEFMIFLGKDDSNSCYEVRVYKSEPGDKYVPNEHDKVSRYEENDEYATFFFEEYEDAHRFTDMVGYLLPNTKKYLFKRFLNRINLQTITRHKY